MNNNNNKHTGKKRGDEKGKWANIFKYIQNEQRQQQQTVNSDRSNSSNNKYMCIWGIECQASSSRRYTRKTKYNAISCFDESAQSIALA